MTEISKITGNSSLSKADFIDLKPLRDVNTKKPISMKSKNANLEEKQLNVLLNNSPLDDRVPNKASLKKMGFEPSKFVDMNGANIYVNDKGDRVRVETRGFGTFVDFTSKDGKVTHRLQYDSDGNPMKGTLIVEDANGSIENINYEYELDGSKNIIEHQTLVRD